MMKKTVWLVLSGLLVAALVLASCGPAAEAPGEEKIIKGEVVEEEAAPVEKEEEVKEEVVAAPTGPQYGGTLRMAACFMNWTGGPTGWDMVKWTWSGHAYASLVMDGLLMGDFDKGPSGDQTFGYTNTDFIPDAAATGAVAESWEFPDPTTAVFYLRKGVRWHNKPPTNGREMTADDLVYSYNRTIGFEEGKGRWPRHSFIESVRAIDKYTFEIKTNAPQGFWGYEFAWGPYFLIYPEEAVDAGLDDWHNAVGTGPFMIEDYVSDASITYERNPDWWGRWTKDGVEYQLPFVDKLVIPIIADEATRVAAVRTAKIDVYQLAPLRLRQQFQDMSEDMQIVTVMRGGSIGMHMRMDRPPTDDLRVRKALQMAIDRQAIIDAFSEGVAMIFFHPLMPADGPDLYTELEDTPPELQEMYEYNPERARELLAEAGYPNGFTTTITIAAEGTSPDVHAMVVENWAAIGVTATLEPLEYATRLARGFDRQYDMFTTGHGARPQVFNDSTREHPWNMSILDDDYYEEQWQKARTEVDVAKRNAILKDLFVYLKGLAPWFDFPSGAEFSAWWPWVNNYNGEVSFGFHKYTYYAYIWLDQDLREQMTGSR